MRSHSRLVTSVICVAACLVAFLPSSNVHHAGTTPTRQRSQVSAVSTVPIDHPDWNSSQTAAGLGASLVNSILALPAGGAVSTPVLPVGQFTEIMVTALVGIAGATVRYTLQWWADAAGTIPAALTQVILSNTQTLDQFLSVVQAPYFSLQIVQTGGALESVNVYIGGSVAGSEMPTFILPHAVVDVQNEPLAASSTNVHYPSHAAPGEYHVWAQGTTQNFGVSVKVWNGVGWDFIHHQTGTGGGDVSFDFVAPVDEWRVEITNLTAIAQNDYVAVVGPH